MIKIILAISAILNSVLIMAVIGPTSFFLYLSIVLNIICVWYIAQLLRQQGNLREDVLDIFNSIESFSDRLDGLHELEAFYGDQTLQDLISHSREVINEIIDLQEKYYDDIEVEVETYDEPTQEKVEEEE